jgi:peptidoglycan hydrolase CwlO-like protein
MSKSMMGQIRDLLVKIDHLHKEIALFQEREDELQTTIDELTEELKQLEKTNE